MSKVTLTELEFARQLLSLFDRAHESDLALPQPDFSKWCGATKDLLIMLGLEFDSENARYFIRRRASQ